jgi:hypothetical protein
MNAATYSTDNFALYIGRINLARNLVVSREVTNWARKKIGHIFLFWKREGKKREAYKYKEV